MTGTTRSSANLDARRRRALFRAWHRGMREMDLILGHFADEEIDSLSEEELRQFEELLEIVDTELFKWVAQGAEAPAAHDTPLLLRIRQTRPLVAR